jgi:hypothetical protein
MTTTTPMTDADELLRAAHGRTYRLPPGFHGFTATVSCTPATRAPWWSAPPPGPA